jgi:hypothetical protein
MLNFVKTSLLVTVLMMTAPAWSMTPQELDALCKEKTLKIVEDINAMAYDRIKLEVRDAEYYGAERSSAATYTVRSADGSVLPYYEVRVRAYDDPEVTPQPFCVIRSFKDLVN